MRELNKSIRRNYPGNLKSAAADMQFKNEQRLVKQLSAPTLEEVDAGLGEHTSLQRIEGMSLRAKQDWIAGIAKAHGMEVILTRRQTHREAPATHRRHGPDVRERDAALSDRGIDARRPTTESIRLPGRRGLT